MESILKVENGPQMGALLLLKQVLDHQQWKCVVLCQRNVLLF